MASQPAAPQELVGRLEEVGRRIGAREAPHGEALQAARDVAEGLRRTVCQAVEGFHTGAGDAGAPHLRVAVGEARLDDKHARAVQFEIARGRCRAIVTVKSRGQVTLVGPFWHGKPEGPCQSFAIDAPDEIGAALGDFLEAFLEEASSP